MIQELINRYKRIRTEHFLRQTYQYSYAFVGMGQHSLTNLYPVLHYLGVPLKYICVTSERKAQLIEQKFPSVKATTSLDLSLPFGPFLHCLTDTDKWQIIIHRETTVPDIGRTRNAH